MNMNSKLGLSLVAAALVTIYGCVKEEPKKADTAKAPAAAAAPAGKVVTAKTGARAPRKGGIAPAGRDDQQGPAVAAYVANELKAKKGAIADDATAYGEGLANEVEKTLKAAGVNVVAREKTNDKATDFKAILTKMKGKNPDAIFYGGMDATAGPMIKQAR